MAHHPRIKLVITDIDGVWTDGSMYYDNLGNELKRFNTSDSAGVLFCRLNDWPVAIMTGEETAIVTHRAQKLNVDFVFMGVKDKLAQAQALCDQLRVSLGQVAFIGDDINDIHLMRAVGYGGTVPDAPVYVKAHAHYITQRSGGSGAFRDFVEHLLSERGLLQSTLRHYLDQTAPNRPPE